MILVHGFEVFVNPVMPVVGHLVERHRGRHDAGDVHGEGDEENHQADVHPDLENPRIEELLALGILGRRFRTHRITVLPVPRTMAGLTR